MLSYTYIVRMSDGLALSADTETAQTQDMERHKLTCKNLTKKLSQSPSLPQCVSVVSQSRTFHVFNENGVMYLTVCDKGSPSAVVFAFLEDICREFTEQYGSQVEGARRPYPFIKFDMYLQKTKKVFATGAFSTGRAQMNQTSSRQPPVQKTFREIMGHNEAGTTSSGSDGSSSSSLTKTDPGIIVVGVIAVVAFIIVIAVILVVVL